MKKMIINFLSWVIYLVLVLGLLFLVIWSAKHQPKEKIINCSVSEISPDFTPAMRDACRKARVEGSNVLLSRD